MNGLFCCDWPIYKDKKGNYYDITLTNDVLKRYLNVVDKLTILIRVEQLDDNDMIKKLSKIDTEKINIVEMPNLLSIKGMLKKNKIIKEKIYTNVCNADLIFIRIPSFIGNEVVKIANEMGKKYLVEVGGCAWDSYWNHSLKGKLIAPYIFLNTRYSVHNASHATYVTNRFLQNRYPCKGNLCECSNVMIDKPDESVLENRIKKIENYKSSRTMVIGTIAAVNVKYKGQEYIIEAISRLNRQGYNFEYHLVGKGDTTYLEDISRKYGVQDKIKFLGIMKPKEILTYLDNIDIYAQPSRQEGLPRAMIEAMSRACPSIGSTTAGIPELIKDTMIFENGNINQICDILKHLDTKEMIEQSIINFEKSKEYEFNILKNRRNLFFKDYLNAVTKK